MKEAFEGIRVGVVATAGFITQMSNLDIIFKALIGFLTVVYLGGKVWKMFRDWKRKDTDV